MNTMICWRRLIVEKLKILIISGEYYSKEGGGIGKLVLDLRDGLIEKGHSTDVIHYCNIKKYENMNKFYKIQKNNFPIISSFLWSYRVKNHLRKILNKRRYDVVHCHMPTAMIYPLIHDKKIPLVITFHTTGTDFTNFIKISLENKKDLLCARRAHELITVSQKVRKELIHLGVEKEKVNYIPNGINLHQKKSFAKDRKILKRYNVEKNDIVFLYVGRINERKGLFYLIQALNRFSEKTKINFKAFIIGDGRYRKEMMRINNHPEKVFFPGFIDKDELTKYYSISDILVFPSLSESLPIVLLESMKHGLGIIASDIDGINDICNPSFSKLIPPKDIMSIYNALIELSENKDLLEKMKNNSRSEVKKFSMDKMIAKTEKVYKRAIGK
ncbi:glycosyltransferase [Candidatus Woesearchaeota archaeon]|nr:glycosyltransferase [Candidatus Woesearchaeota archaeon]